MGWSGLDSHRYQGYSASGPFSTLTYCAIVSIGLAMCSVQGASVLVKGTGASSPNEVYQRWQNSFHSFRAQFSEVTIDYSPTSSQGGIDAIEIEEISDEGYVHFAGSDTTSESLAAPQSPYAMFPTMAGAVVACYNLEKAGFLYSESSDPLVLSLDVLGGIYNGSIQYWNDSAIMALNKPEIQARLPDEKIVVLARKDDSGTTEVFTTALATLPSWNSAFSEAFNEDGEPINWPESAITYYAESSTGMVGLLKSFDYSIAYMSSSSAEGNELTSASLRNDQGAVTSPNIAAVQASMNEFVEVGAGLTDELSLYTSDASYPIASFTYFIVRKHSPHCAESKELVRYIDWFLTEGQADDEAQELDMVPLINELSDGIHDNVLYEMTCGLDYYNVWDLVQEDITSEEFSLVKNWLIPVLVTIGLLLMGLFIVAFYYGYKRIKFNQMLDKNEWEIPVEDILFYSTARTTSGKNRFVLWPSLTSLTEVDDIEDGYQMVQQILQWPGKYNSTHIGLRLLEIKGMSKIKRRTKALLLWMKDSCHHSNVLAFYGLTEVQRDRYTVSEYCSKGPLSDILKDMKFNLNKDFKFSLLTDIGNGLVFLHSKDIIHGFLTSTKCLVDIKWTVKIADWEYCKLYTHLSNKKSPLVRLRKDADEIGKEEAAFQDFWSAPELVQSGFINHPTMECDIYSYCIILQEIWTRNDPYYEHKETMTNSDLIKAIVGNQLRPMNHPDTPGVVRQAMEQGWLEDASKRPTCEHILKILHSAVSFKKSVLDTVMEAVDDYTLTIEERLARRSAELDKRDKKLHHFVERNIPTVFQLQALQLAESSGVVTEDQTYSAVMVLFKVLHPPVSLRPGTIITLLSEADQLIAKIAKKHDGFMLDLGSGLFGVFHGIGGDTSRSSFIINAANVAWKVTEYQRSNGRSSGPAFLCAVHKGSVCLGLVDHGLPRCQIVGETIEKAHSLLHYAKPNQIIASRTFFKALLSEGPQSNFTFTKTDFLVDLNSNSEEAYWLQGTSVIEEAVSLNSNKLSPKDDTDSEASTPATTPTGWRRLLGLGPRRSSATVHLEMRRSPVNFTQPPEPLLESSPDVWDTRI